MEAVFSLYQTGRTIPDSDKVFWRLSTLLARRFHSPTTLYADSLSARRLESWGIKFDHVDTTILERDVKNAHPMCWSAGKIAAMREHARKGNPFFHIDGDAFLFEPLKPEFQGAQLFCQCIEKQLRRSSNRYRKNSHYPINEMLPDMQMPRWMHKYRDLPRQRVMNMGIFGGNDLGAIYEYADISLNTFVWNRHNIQVYKRMTRSLPHFLGIACVAEQWSLGAYCHWKHIMPLQIMDRIDAFNVNRMHEVGFGHMYSALRRMRQYQKWAKLKLDSVTEPLPKAA